MTIGGWVLFFVVAVIIVVFAVIICVMCESKIGELTTVLIAVSIVVLLLFGMLWYFGNTASGQRMLIDERSELSHGLERVVTVYTADGKVLAQYKGFIDFEQNDGGYVKFDFDGKRYVYYNCFVESIADIGNRR